MRTSGIAAFVVMAAVLYSQRGGTGTDGAPGPGEESAPNVCRVRLTLTDAGTGRPQPGLVKIVGPDGKPVRVDSLLSRGLGIEGSAAIHAWNVVPRAVEFDLPQGRYEFTAISGLEHEAARREVDLAGRERSDVSLALERFYDAAQKGLSSGNTHLHLMKVSRETSDRYLTEVPRADGLDLLFVSYLERAGADHEYTSNTYTSADLAQLARESGVLIANGEEHRHNFTGFGEGYGHVMFLNLTRLVQPVSIGPGIMRTGDDGLPLARGIDTARRDGARVVWCHNEWGLEALPNWFSGRIDAQNIFDGSTRSSYKDSFYRYLNAGLRVPFSTGTDWFLYDFSRVYVRAAGPPSVAAWLKGLAAGRTFITNSPLLELEVAGRLPGDTVEIPAARAVEVVARAAGRVDFRKIELVRSGEIAASAPSRPVGGHFEAELRLTLELAEPCWLALRTPPPSVPDDAHSGPTTPLNELGKEIFAHTSPVYVEVAGRSTFDRSVAGALLEQMRTNRARASEQGTFEDELSRARVLDVYDAGIAVLEEKLGRAND